jgi:hypothetical protein
MRSSLGKKYHSAPALDGPSLCMGAEIPVDVLCIGIACIWRRRSMEPARGRSSQVVNVGNGNGRTASGGALPAQGRGPACFGGARRGAAGLRLRRRRPTPPPRCGSRRRSFRPASPATWPCSKCSTQHLRTRPAAPMPAAPAPRSLQKRLRRPSVGATASKRALRSVDTRRRGLTAVRRGHERGGAF